MKSTGAKLFFYCVVAASVSCIEFIQSPEASVLSMEESRQYLPTVKLHSVGLHAIFKSDEESKTLPSNSYVVLYSTQSYDRRHPWDTIRLTFQSPSCHVERYALVDDRMVIPATNHVLVNKRAPDSSIKAIQYSLTTLDRYLPLGTKILLYIPPTCVDLKIQKASRHLIQPSRALAFRLRRRVVNNPPELNLYTFPKKWLSKWNLWSKDT